MNDMQANVERLRNLLDPARRDPSDTDGSSFVGLYTEDAKLRWQGVDWPWGGDMIGRDKLRACMQVTSRLFTEPPVFEESEFWVLDDERLLWWWRSRGTTFRGEALSNSGMTLMRFRDNRICEHWEYTDTQYLAHLFRGWRELVEPEVGTLLANWQPPGPVPFPDPGSHT